MFIFNLWIKWRIRIFSYIIFNALETGSRICLRLFSVVLSNSCKCILIIYFHVVSMQELNCSQPKKTLPHIKRHALAPTPCQTFKSGAIILCSWECENVNVHIKIYSMFIKYQKIKSRQQCKSTRNDMTRVRFWPETVKRSQHAKSS